MRCDDGNDSIYVCMDELYVFVLYTRACIYSSACALLYYIYTLDAYRLPTSDNVAIQCHAYRYTYTHIDVCAVLSSCFATCRYSGLPHSFRPNGSIFQGYI